MIKVLDESQGNAIILQAVGKLTDEDYKEVLIPRLEAIIREHGKARILMDFGGDFEGWQPAAAWDDFRFGMAHRQGRGEAVGRRPPRQALLLPRANRQGGRSAPRRGGVSETPRTHGVPRAIRRRRHYMADHIAQTPHRTHPNRVRRRDHGSVFA